jgi:hypothetical protein
MYRIFILLTIMFTLSSCTEEYIKVDQKTFKVAEEGTIVAPSVVEEEPKPVRLIEGSYKVTDLNVDQPLDSAPFLIRTISNVLVNLFMSIRGVYDIEVPPIEVDLNEIDLSLVKVAKIKWIDFQVKGEAGSEADLEFIKKIKIGIKNKEGKLDYLINTTLDKDELECDGKCLAIRVNPLNLIDYIDDKRQVTIVPKFKIEKAPKESFLIDAKIGFAIGVTLPFEKSYTDKEVYQLVK